MALTFDRPNLALYSPPDKRLFSAVHTGQAFGPKVTPWDVCAAVVSEILVENRVVRYLVSNPN
jgi:hypothetical protein